MSAFPARRGCGALRGLLVLGMLCSVAGAAHYDVCVYGGNAAAVTAAMAASRNGASTVLVNPGRHLGGMVSGGLGVTDAGRIASIGGIASEFFHKLGAHYGRKGPSFRHEPHVAGMVFQDFLKESGVSVFPDAPLAAEHAVVVDSSRIVGIRIAGDRLIEAKVFIDASYEGDLLAAAGVRSLIGRESRETYGEELAGVRKAIRHGDPTLASDEQGVLPDIYQGDPGTPGAGDEKVMSYNFRLCMTRDPENGVGIGKPTGYDRRRYTLLSRVVLSQPKATLRSIFSIGELPGGKADFNNIGPISSNLLNASWRYPGASPAERRRIWTDHQDYLQGLLYFLQNDADVPARIQAEAREWALARDEFTDTAHWPHQLYIREARRMIGEKVMTQHDLQKRIVQPDSVGMGSYMMDSHYVQRTVSEHGVFSEGTLGGDHRVVPYQISYRSLIPVKRECTNLLVPVCLSASHVAYSSLRMEPVYMILGHSAGTAAALAARLGVAVQDLDYAELRRKLEEERQVLEYELLGQLDPEDLEGIVLDEAGAKLRGTWSKSTSGEPFVGAGYIHDNNTDKGNRTATYSVPLPRPGAYEVRLISAAGSNRSTRTKITVRTASGLETARVNQKEVLPSERPYHSLGVYEFGSEAIVEISNEGSDGVVVADAVQLVPVLPGAEESRLPKIIERLAARIRTMQLSDGALRMSATTDVVRVVPYFANIAALALLSTGNPDDLESVRRWMEWYAANQEADGTIFDFSGTVGKYGKTSHRDSTDSYAATFLQLAWRFSQVVGDEALTPALRLAAVRAVDAMALTVDADGLTWAKPEYKAKYFMDNLEVCLGADDAEKLFANLGDAEAARRAASLRERCAEALASFWKPEAGHFAWAKGSSEGFHVRFERWYPEGVVHLFALAALQSPPEGLWEKVQRQFGTETRITPEWWLRASGSVGTEEERRRFREETEAFAEKLCAEGGQLNRLGTTLLALTETDISRSTVKVRKWPAESVQ